MNYFTDDDFTPDFSESLKRDVEAVIDGFACCFVLLGICFSGWTLCWEAMLCGQ